jgi:hypothetical protein
VSDDNEVIKHESFGAAVVVRQTGGDRFMFRSDVPHPTRISLRIQRADLHRRLHEDGHFADESLVEVQFSELQWAQLLSSIGQGNGVPCTIAYVGSKRMEDCPGRDTYGMLKAETKAKADRALKTVDRIVKRLAEIAGEKRITKAMIAEIAALAATASTEVRANMPFVTAMVEEAAEQTKMAAQAQVDGFIQDKIVQLGLEGITTTQIAKLMLTDAGKTDEEK